MSILRRFVPATALMVTVPIVITVASSGGPAFAGAPPVNATGTVSCGSMTGSLKFTPALTNAGGSSEVVKAKLNLAGCSAAGSNVTSPTFTGKAKGSWSVPTNQCSIIFSGSPSSAPGSLTIKWSGKTGVTKLNPTILMLTSLTGVTAGSNGNAGFTFASQTTTGSFAGTMSGEIDSNESAATVNGQTGCGATKGLKEMTIAAGSSVPPATPSGPTVTSVFPSSGPTSGGTSVTITGTNLSGAIAVDFGSNAGQITADSATSITATSPPGSGTVGVTVITATGTSQTSPADEFSYTAASASFPTGFSATITYSSTVGYAAQVQFSGGVVSYVDPLGSSVQLLSTSPSGTITNLVPVNCGPPVDVTAPVDPGNYFHEMQIEIDSGSVPGEWGINSGNSAANAYSVPTPGCSGDTELEMNWNMTNGVLFNPGAPSVTISQDVGGLSSTAVINFTY